MKFGTRVRLKHSNDRGEFELDRAKSNNIAENSFALGHKTHNRSVCYCNIFIIAMGATTFINVSHCYKSTMTMTLHHTAMSLIGIYNNGNDCYTTLRYLLLLPIPRFILQCKTSIGQVMTILHILNLLSFWSCDRPDSPIEIT